MRYVPPFGASDPNASYVNGNPTTGIQGSIPPAAMMENPQRELISVIERSGLIPTDADLQQLTRSIRSQHLNYAEDTGSVNYISVAYNPPLQSYTRGLTLRVRMRNTNTGAVRINAGAGTVPVRRMNGAEVNESELPAASIATLVFDGTVFQLSNFGGAGGAGDTEIFQVRIPYAVDLSPVQGVIVVDFNPEIEAIAAGDMIAVKIQNTNYGPTVMRINNLPDAECRPNGGGLMLQGDLHSDDLVLFIFDGQFWCFAPNPEINQWVMYTVGNGQQFLTVAEALDAIRRKTIGASGYVHLQLAAQTFYATNAADPTVVIRISHPSADRIALVGTMVGPRPEWNHFSATSNTSAGMAQDAIFNINMLRARYGTIIQIPPAVYPATAWGILQAGPGKPAVIDVLVIGNRPPVWPQGWAEGGFIGWAGFSMTCHGCAAWGCSMGFYADTSRMDTYQCFACGSTHWGFTAASGGTITVNQNGSFGNDVGYMSHSSAYIHYYNSYALQNGQFGLMITGAANADLWYAVSLGNGHMDLYGQYNSVAVSSWTVGIGNVSPYWNTPGNLNALNVLGQGLEFAPPPIV